MQMHEVAERILFAQTLEEKLLLAPDNVSDTVQGKAHKTPDHPGRPEQLIIVPKGMRGDFPGVNKLEDEAERGRMLHFLANHELLATELMALVLLKFPDAPAKFRQGVYETMREEQVHTLMYMRRMKECGIHFGELPVNDYFWKLIAPMESPMDFVTRLSLTFEQANLDFSKHYGALFRQVGDTGTAAVLDKIYLDEIQHVGHGLQWFREWKNKDDSDWEAYNKSLKFPLGAAKAKGMAPFNIEGREQAGLDSDFISRLELFEQSRGRTPVIHWYNPNAESYTAAAIRGQKYNPNKSEQAIEQDLELLSLAWCRRDDVSLVRNAPSQEHLRYLKSKGVQLPEFITEGSVIDRKLGGLRPWAWSPDASETLKPCAEYVSDQLAWQWRDPLPPLFLSKRLGVELNNELGLEKGASVYCESMEQALSEISKCMSSNSEGVLLKAPYACAGRGHKRIKPHEGQAFYHAWLEKVIKNQGGIVIEPYLDKVMDFSALYEVKQGGVIDLIGMTEMENDSSGRFLATKVYQKWGSDLSEEIRRFYFTKAQGVRCYSEIIPALLTKLLTGYIGPVGVDAMIYRQADGSLALRHVVEVNTRMSMGRVALELQKKYAAGKNAKLSILRKKNLTSEQISTLYSQVINNDSGDGNMKRVLLNDPYTAVEFIALWES